MQSLFWNAAKGRLWCGRMGPAARDEHGHPAGSRRGSGGGCRSGRPWRGSLRHEPPVRNAYRWFAVAALLWGAGFVAQEATAASGGGTSLTFADLLSLLALPAIGIGLAGQSRAAGGDRAAPRAQARGALAWLADACLMAAALFVIAWLAVFGSEYHKLGESPGVFTTQAVHPIADILALGALLALAVRAAARASRRTSPYSWWPWASRSRSAPGSAGCDRGRGLWSSS